MRDATVNLFTQSHTGAPALSGTAGSLIAVLDACLVNGYGSQTVDQLVVANEVATLSINGGHAFTTGLPSHYAYSRITISGATNGAINGNYQVLAVISSTQFTVEMPGVADGPASGTITYKRMPLGWSKVYSGTNKAVYRSNSVSGTRKYLRIDDSGPGTGGAREARAAGYATMSDVDTGTIRFPTTAQLANGIIIRKSSTLDATARSWYLVGDHSAFYLMVAYSPSYSYADLFVFGDLVDPRLPGDTTHCIIWGPQAEGGTVSHPSNSSYTTPGLSSGFTSNKYAYIAEGVGSQVGLPQQCAVCGDPSVSYRWGNGGFSNPLAVDNGYRFSKVMVYAQQQDRGLLPGIYQPLHSLTGYFRCDLTQVAPGDIRDLVGLDVAATNEASVGGTASFDFTGPWR